MPYAISTLAQTPGPDIPTAPARRLTVGVVCHASDGGRSGIGQYLVNVVRRFPQIAPSHRFVLFFPQRDAGLWEGLGPQVTLVPQPDSLEAPLRSMSWHLHGLRTDLAAHGCDAVFLPAGNRRLGWRYGVPSVATVHDLSQLHVPGKYDLLRMLHARHLMPALMRRQDRLVCVSDNTRRDVLTFARAEAGRVSVVHNGADLARFSTRRPGRRGRLARRFGIYGPFVLYVARLEHPGKNHVMLLEAFARLVKDGRHPHRLVLAGPDWSGSEAIHERIRRLGLGDRVITTGFVATEDLPDLYQGAELFVFPSLYEGFGIPLVEAMTAGTAACVARRGSLPEVAADAALLFDPTDATDIARTMEQLLTDATLRERLVARGRQRANEFDWDRCTARVVQHIEEACAASS